MLNKGIVKYKGTIFLVKLKQCLDFIQLFVASSFGRILRLD